MTRYLPTPGRSSYNKAAPAFHPYSYNKPSVTTNVSTQSRRMDHMGVGQNTIITQPSMAMELLQPRSPLEQNACHVELCSLSMEAMGAVNLLCFYL